LLTLAGEERRDPEAVQDAIFSGNCAWIIKSRVSYQTSALYLLEEVFIKMLAARARSVTRIHHLLVRTMASGQTPDAFLIPFDSNNDSTAAPFQAAKLWSSGRPKNKADEAKIFYDVDQKGTLAAIVSVGSSKDDLVKKEAVRRAAGIGAKKLREAGAKVIAVDPSLDPHAAGR
jgi:hypothetical protein